MPQETTATINENQQRYSPAHAHAAKHENNSHEESENAALRVKPYNPPAIIEKRNLRIDLMKDTAESPD